MIDLLHAIAAIPEVIIGIAQGGRRSCLVMVLMFAVAATVFIVLPKKELITIRRVSTADETEIVEKKERRITKFVRWMFEKE